MGRSDRVPIAIIGGSGIYDPGMFVSSEKRKVYTPYGHPSAQIEIGDYKGLKVAFLPRHGEKHSIPPHAINFRANIWALKELGVERVLAPSAVGSLQEDYKPGELVLPEQFIDRTWGRPGTFYDGGVVAHVSMADPFCPEMIDVLQRSAEQLRVPLRRGGTYVCIQGPRFSTRAESRMFRSLGAEIVGMTLIPEVSLAREARMCYCTLAAITDYDVWADEPVSAEEVVRTMAENTDKVKRLLADALSKIPPTRGCSCGRHMDQAFM